VEPIQYLRALRRRWWVIGAAVALSAAVGWATTAAVTPAPAARREATYAASTVLWSPEAVSSEVSSASMTVETISNVLTLPDVAVIAARRMQFQGSPLVLMSRVEATADSSSGFVTVTGFAPDAEGARRTSAAFSSALITHLRQVRIRQIDEKQAFLQNQIRVLRGRGAGPILTGPLQVALSELSVARINPVSLGVLQPATTAELIPAQTSEAPASPLSRIPIAALIGLAAGVALALVLERFDTKIRTREAAESAFGLPVLVEVPVISRRRRRGVVTASHPVSRAADVFRLLSAEVARWVPRNERQANGNGKTVAQPSSPKTILVTSPEPKDGKTTVAANLAAAYAEVGNRVLVLSCDLRHPSIHKVFGVPPSPGLAEALGAMNGELTRDEPLDLRPYLGQPTVDRVTVLASGARPERPAELLGSAKMQRFVQRAKEVADVVVLDGAPLLVANDVVPLAPHVDAVVLVARSGRTSIALAGRTAGLLERLGANVVGVVLNDSGGNSIPRRHRQTYRPPRGPRKPSRRESKREPEPKVAVPAAPPPEDPGLEMWISH
jgi:capsular exopolysaccharide synthesis family protein